MNNDVKFISYEELPFESHGLYCGNLTLEIDGMKYEFKRYSLSKFIYKGNLDDADLCCNKGKYNLCIKYFPNKLQKYADKILEEFFNENIPYDYLESC